MQIANGIIALKEVKMSFECKYYNKGKCELMNKDCKPGQKGCVLNNAGIRFIGQDDTKDSKNGDDSRGGRRNT